MADTPKSLQSWRKALVGLGIVLIVAAVVMEWDILSSSSTKTVTVSGDVTTTVTGAPAPAGGLVTGALGLGVACLLVAAFFDRIKKISIGAVEIELDAASVGTIATLAAQRVGGDLAKIGPLVTAAIASLEPGIVVRQSQAINAPATDVSDTTFVRAIETAAARLNY